MTRPHYSTIHCPCCGSLITEESAFGRWIRNCAALDSLQQGIAVLDQDYWIHRWKRDFRRQFQCLMLVEIKTRGADLTPSQRETLWAIDQISRNRVETPTSMPRPQAGRGPTKV